MTFFDEKLPFYDRMDLIQDLQSIVKHAQHTVMVTGAGMSEGCGLPTLNTTVKRRPFHQWFTRRTFIEDPIWFYDVYRDIFRQWSGVQPNKAYDCVARAGIPIITQNVDGLHVKSGSQTVIELHGNVRELICDDCANLFPSTYLLQSGSIPTCPSCISGVLRPNIVFEGEEVHHFAQAVDLVGNADVLIIVGTQLKMEPCNQLPQIVHNNGGEVIVLNEHAEILIPNIWG